MARRQHTILIGVRDEFSCQGLIGRGGNGDVLLSFGKCTGRCAIKLLRSNSAYSKQRMTNEIRALESLRHVPGIMPLLDRSSDESEDLWYAMPLAEPIAEHAKTMSFWELCSALADIAKSIATAHGLGYSHRDIKIDNLFWLDHFPVVGDWGLVKHAAHKAITTDRRKLGSQFYIAPEMLNSAESSDGKMADVYSLAKVSWVLMTGQTYPLPGEHDPLYPSQTIETLVSESKSRELDYLLNAMTRQDPQKRISMLEVEENFRVMANRSVHTERVDVAHEVDGMENLNAAIRNIPVRQKAVAHKVAAAHEALIQMKDRVPKLLMALQKDGSSTTKTFMPVPSVCPMHVVMDATRLFGQEYEYTVDFAIHETVNRISMCFGVHLMKDDRLVVGARVSVHAFMKNTPISSFPTPLYSHESSELIGTPASSDAIAKVLAGFERSIPIAARDLAQLLSD